LKLERATSRLVRVKWDKASPPDGELELVVTDAHGNIVQQNPLMKQGAEALGFVGGLVVGTYTVEVRGTRQASATLIVETLEPTNDALVIELR
jgi:hypothetical protein